MLRAGKLWMLLVAVVLAGVVGWAFHSPGGQPREVAFMGAIFVVAAWLWTTEALPLFATALLVVGLQIILLANPGGWSGLGFQNGPSPTFPRLLAAAVDPVLLLFFGGFLLAQAAAKEGVDRLLSALLLRPFGTRPAALLFGVMLITAGCSMWMSNTATTVMMLAVIGPVLVVLPIGAPLRTSLLLGVPFAANLGGLATPIGTPPNLVAIGFLEQSGHHFSFLAWMAVALPVAALMLVFTWWLLLRLHPSGDEPLSLELQAPRPTRRGWIVMGVFATTVLLWLTDTLTGLPAPVVALLPAVVFPAAGILGSADLKSIDWDVLLLIGGGVSLGVGMQLTGLDRVVVSWLPIASTDGLVLIALLVVTTLVLSTFMSNTAAANLLLPVGISTAMIAESVTTFEAAVATALAASMAMTLPISTPPNAIVFGRGGVTTRQMAVPGAIIGVVGILLLLGIVPLLLRLVGGRD